MEDNINIIIVRYPMLLVMEEAEAAKIYGRVNKYVCCPIKEKQ